METTLQKTHKNPFCSLKALLLFVCVLNVKELMIVYFIYIHFRLISCLIAIEAYI